MKVLLSHPTGNTNVRAAAMGLYNAGILGEFWTTIATFPGNSFGLLSTLPGFSEFKRRGYDPLFQRLTKTWPWFELGRFASKKIGLNMLSASGKGLFSIDTVYRNFDKRVAENLKKANEDIKTVYAYEDGSLFSFLAAKAIGMKCFYELPTGYWRTVHQIVDNERERHPDWALTLTGRHDSDDKLHQKDEELKLADRIFVASSFVANSLREFPGKLAPVEVIPYGFPPVCNSRNYPSISRKPLKLLFVGKLSQMKGIAELFSAVEYFGKQVALTLVGHKISDKCLALDKALAKHKWIPSLPHHEILKIMREHDILVFPSLLEGFGLVITEAMSQGTPVITTERTIGLDLIKDQENGWLIEAGSTESLVSAIENILSRPGIIEKAGRLAIETASKRPWQVYEQELVQRILKLN